VTLRRLIFLLLGFTLFFSAGCKPREITSLQRKQAAHFASEAEFAMTLKDFPRAEGLYRQAADLCPDTPDYWENLGVARRKMGNLSGARTAYQQALATRIARYKQGKNPDDLLQQAWLLVLLGRDDEAVKLMQKGRASHPDDTRIRQAADPKWLEGVKNSPAIKEIAL
jgi:Flp pilus assembly protein TadD